MSDDNQLKKSTYNFLTCKHFYKLKYLCPHMVTSCHPRVTKILNSPTKTNDTKS